MRQGGTGGSQEEEGVSLAGGGDEERAGGAVVGQTERGTTGQDEKHPIKKMKLLLRIYK